MSGRYYQTEPAGRSKIERCSKFGTGNLEVRPSSAVRYRTLFSKGGCLARLCMRFLWRIVNQESAHARLRRGLQAGAYAIWQTHWQGIHRADSQATTLLGQRTLRAQFKIAPRPR
jgi:serine kinase of HPr protein (carbohydrate metabolism regulator)